MIFIDLSDLMATVGKRIDNDTLIEIFVEIMGVTISELHKFSHLH